MVVSLVHSTVFEMTRKVISLEYTRRFTRFGYFVILALTNSVDEKRTIG